MILRQRPISPGTAIRLPQPILRTAFTPRLSAPRSLSEMGSSIGIRELSLSFQALSGCCLVYCLRNFRFKWLNTDGENKTGLSRFTTFTEQTNGEALCNSGRCVDWDRGGIFHWSPCGVRLALSDQQPMRDLRGFHLWAYRIGMRSCRWLDPIAASDK